MPKMTRGTKSDRDSGWANASARNGALDSRTARDETPNQIAPTGGERRITSNPMTKGAAIAKRKISALPWINIGRARETRTPNAVAIWSRRHPNPLRGGCPSRDASVPGPCSRSAAGFFGSFDVEWEEPAHRLFLQHLASFARVIRFDQFGTGASDPVPLDALPPWEALAEEMEAVMDAAGSGQAAIIAGGPAPPAALLFAASRPERVRALVLFMAAVRYLEDEDYPIGMSPERLRETMSRFQEGWGTGLRARPITPL